MISHMSQVVKISPDVDVAVHCSKPFLKFGTSCLLYVSIGRLVSLELPTGTYIVKPGGVVQTPRPIKPRQGLPHVWKRVRVCSCVRLGGVMAIFISASGPLCFPLHQAPAVVEASQALSPVTLLWFGRHFDRKEWGVIRTLFCGGGSG